MARTLIVFLSTATWLLSATRLPAAERAGVTNYFPAPESQGGWRVLRDSAQLRSLAGVDPDKLAELKDWLQQSDTRNFAAVVVRRGYVVLEVERGPGARTNATRVASVSKAICATVLA